MLRDRKAHPWFPELARVESRAERKALWRAAYYPVLKSWRYWFIAIASQAGCQVAFRRVTVQLLRQTGVTAYTHLWSICATAVGAALASLLTLWLVRRRIARNMRAELLKRGKPTCLSCGYDLRGQQDPRCPECGTPFNPIILVPAPQQPQSPPPDSSNDPQGPP